MDSLALTYAFHAYEDQSSVPQLHCPLALLPVLKKGTISLMALGLAASICANPALATISRGDSGLDVEYLQEQLKAAGYFPHGVPSTGYFGSITEEALRHYQADMGLTVDGVAGAETHAALEGGTAVTTTNGHRDTDVVLQIRVREGASFPVAGPLTRVHPYPLTMSIAPVALNCQTVAGLPVAISPVAGVSVSSTAGL